MTVGLEPGSPGDDGRWGPTLESASAWAEPGPAATPLRVPASPRQRGPGMPPGAALPTQQGPVVGLSLGADAAPALCEDQDK